MRFAPGKRAVLIRRLTTMDRAGQARRRLMARDLGACGITIVPAAYVDPVTTPLFVQSPPTNELREKMISEFESIKSGF